MVPDFYDSKRFWCTEIQTLTTHWLSQRGPPQGVRRSDPEHINAPSPPHEEIEVKGQGSVERPVPDSFCAQTRSDAPGRARLTRPSDMAGGRRRLVVPVRVAGG